MGYVLIFWLWAGNGAVPATAYFMDKQACEVALQTVTKMTSPNFRNGFCTPDRTKP